MKSFSFVFLATIVARLSSLISFPITARVLPVSDMGDLTIWHSVRGIILLAVLAGMPDVVAREAGAHKSKRAFSESLKISYTMLAFITVGFEALLLLSPDSIGVQHPHLLLVAAGIDVIPGLFLSSLAAMGRTRSYVICIVIPALVVASLSAILVLPPFSLGLVGPLYAHLIASAVNAIICLWFWFKQEEPEGAPSYSFLALLRQSLPVLGVSLVGMSIATIDRYSIRWFLGATAVGYYAVSYQVAALLSFGGASVRTSLLPKLIANANVPNVIRQYFVDYLVCGGAFALVLAALAPEIVHLLAGSKYELDVQLVPILCGAIFALELYSYGQALAVARRHPQQAFYSIAAGAAVALVLVPSLCYGIGAEGVPLGLLAGYLLASAFLLGKNGLVSWKSLAPPAGLAVILGALYVQYSHPETIWTVPSRSMRYVLAAIGVGLGFALLRKLGKEKT